MTDHSPTATGTPDRPQFATLQDAVISGLDWFFEPCWKGERLLARFQGGDVHLTDEEGNPAPEELREAAEVLRNAVDADQALLDGSWTAMPFTGVGTQARERSKAIAAEAGATAALDPASFETRRAFVAWDLVELDGASLHDIPYQERRRLLSSVIIESVRVRVSPAMRPPIRGWLEALRADGFTHYLAKHANSRYLPGETAPDWLKLSVLSDAQPTILERLFGQSQRRVPKLPPRQR